MKKFRTKNKAVQFLSDITNKKIVIASDKKIFVLVGPPSVGKSTWIQQNFDETPYIISRDDIVEQVASSKGWTYDDMFVNPPSNAELGETDEKYGKVVKSPPYIKWSDTSFSNVLEANNEVQQKFNDRLRGATSSGKNIVVDMTNMHPGARRNALRAIKGAEDEYEKIAVVFAFEGFEDVIKKVSQKRAEAAKRMGKSKTIPDSAFEMMFKSYKEPSKSEGFDRIVSIDNTELLKELAEEGEGKMASELRFASENEALQHLANITGKRVKIAEDSENPGDLYSADGVDIYVVEKGKFDIIGETWEDPGDHPAGRLPSRTYSVAETDKHAKIRIELSDGATLKKKESTIYLYGTEKVEDVAEITDAEGNTESLDTYVRWGDWEEYLFDGPKSDLKDIDYTITYVDLKKMDNNTYTCEVYLS